MTTMTSQTFTFDLRGNKLNVIVGEQMTGAYTASYISLMGLGEILGDDVVKITRRRTPSYGYVPPRRRRTDSKIIQMLNPPQRFPAVDMNTRLTVRRRRRTSTRTGPPRVGADAPRSTTA